MTIMKLEIICCHKFLFQDLKEYIQIPTDAFLTTIVCAHKLLFRHHTIFKYHIIV